MALRIIGLCSALLLAAGLSAGEADAAGRGGGFIATAPQRAVGAAGHRHAGQSMRIGVYRHAAGRGFRHGGPRRWVWGGPGYADPWWFRPQAGGISVAVIRPPAETARPVDPDSFENLTARAGIRRGPAPEPTIYRLEGPRMAPGARVIRIAGAETEGGRQTRYAHAETGALLLMVPRR